MYLFRTQGLFVQERVASLLRLGGDGSWSTSAHSLLGPCGLQLAPLRPSAVFFFRATASTRRRSAGARSLLGPLGLQLAPLGPSAVFFFRPTSSPMARRRCAGARSLLSPLGLQLLPLSPPAVFFFRPTSSPMARRGSAAACSLRCTLLLSSTLLLALPAEVLLFLSFAALSIAAPSFSSALHWPTTPVARRHRNELRECGSQAQLRLYPHGCVQVSGMSHQ